MKPDPEEGARVVMGLVMIVLAALGAALVKNTGDDPMTVFGYALMIFGIAYVVGLVRQHCDAIDRANAVRHAQAIPHAEAAE